MTQRVAVLGLGLMGRGMASNLLRAGFPLTVYNRSHDKAAPLAAEGARVAETPRQAAEEADILISMVADDTASRAIWLGDAGALAAARAGMLLIECSTLSTAWVRELAGLAAGKGCALLDAPVTGSQPQAEAGELGFFVGGDAETLRQATPVLNAMGQRINHLGPTGSGATMKLVNNLMGGVQIVALAEGLALAEQAGLDMEQVITLLSNGAPGSPMVKNKGPRMVARNYETQFALRWEHKDLTYALEEGVHQTVPLPTVAAAREIYRMAMARGLGDLDLSAVIEALRPRG
ncbi:MAG: NAD(P)-dependent oxidoreductase [Anaerolineae bacterium]